MNIRRWLRRTGPLLVATLGLTAAVAVVSPAPASASTNVFCVMGLDGPRTITNGTQVTAGATFYCSFGLASSYYLAYTLYRDGAIIATSQGAAPSIGATVPCYPGNYMMVVSGSVLYPYGNIPQSDSFFQQGPSVPITCVPPPPVPLTVKNPGSQTTVVSNFAEVDMYVTGGTAPYTWSATGLPTGLSIDSSGEISGVAYRAGGYTVTVTAVDAAGHSGSTSFAWSVRISRCNCPITTAVR